MDIKKELKEIENNPDCLEHSIKRVLLEQEELKKKLHLIKVIGLSNKIEKAVKDGHFKKPEIVAIQLVFEYYNDENYKIDFYLKTKENEYISEFSGEEAYNKQIRFLKKLLKDTGPFEINFMNRSKSRRDIELKVGVKDNFLKIFLSKELRKIYDYNKMDLDLTVNDVIPTKKLKI
jgi:hypothetical protein